MAPNLNCRMVQSVFPELGSVVMARIIMIDTNGVSANLLEYNDLTGRMGQDTDPDCIEESFVGRIEPLKVVSVDTDGSNIVLNRSTVLFPDKVNCEQVFNMRKYVHSVLVSIAEDYDKDLETIYEQTRWPSYDGLQLLDKADWLKKALGKKLRSALLERIKLMQYFSWRIQAPWILNLCYLIQKLATCWAFAMVRQVEAYLKLNRELPLNVYLSYQDLINKVPKDLFQCPEENSEENSERVPGALDRLDPLCDLVTKVGVVRKEQCPLTHSLEEEPLKNSVHAYTVEKAKVMESHRRNRKNFEEDMIDDLHHCPISASVLWFESYKGQNADDVILTPTTEEIRKFKYTVCDGVPVHTMLLTGHGVDKRGKRFLEFQDCNGDLLNGDRGYVRLAQEPNPVIEYVQITPHPVH